MSDIDDVVMEPEDGEGNSANAAQKLKDLREKLKGVEKMRDEYLDSLQRMKADYVNAKNRFETDMKALAKFASEGVITELLPVMDALDSAIAHTEQKEGIERIRNQLAKLLFSQGVEAVEPLEKLFDPSTMESVEILEVEDKNRDNVVTTVHQKGYTLHGRTIRPARVAVGHYKGS